SNKQQATSNKQQATSNKQQATRAGCFVRPPLRPPLADDPVPYALSAANSAKIMSLSMLCCCCARLSLLARHGP
ncbi:MAG: hypothetical protein ACTIKR_19970, partial [Advenella sp.]|uniref:hypothetical protein n=1 Tax=Advenella sp. TaxID=1872388 RepID=UPI003F9A36A9